MFILSIKVVFFVERLAQFQNLIFEVFLSDKTQKASRWTPFVLNLAA